MPPSRGVAFSEVHKAGKRQTADVRGPEPRPAVELPILRNNASGPKLPPLRCTVPGSHIRDRRTGTAQNGYLGQKREQSADQRGTIQKPHLKTRNHKERCPSSPVGNHPLSQRLRILPAQEEFSCRNRSREDRKSTRLNSSHLG